MEDKIIELDSPFGVELGFTSDKFDGYLWKHGKFIVISFIISLQEGQGNLSKLFEAIESKGYGIKVPTPFARMRSIVMRRGFKMTIEPFAPEAGIMDLCEIWVKEPN